MTENNHVLPNAQHTLGVAFWLTGFVLLVLMPLLNVLPAEDSWLHFSDFSLNRFGKFLAFAILALGLDLIWGYTGMLSLGQGVFFGLGAYCMGMHLMLTIGKESVYGSDLPDFMVWNQVKQLPLFWKPFYSFPVAIVGAILVPTAFALVFGFLAFRSRIKGVYFAIITQALALVAWLVFNRNETNLGGTNGLTDFKQLLGFRLSEPGTQRALYVLTVLCLGGAYLLCQWITRSRAGRVLIAVRDSEQRVVFSGYTPANYKLFVFVVAAALAGLGRYALCAASRDHHTSADWCLALAGNGYLGGGRRTGNFGWRRPGSGQRQFRAQCLDQLFSGVVAVYSRRTLRDRRPACFRTVSSESCGRPKSKYDRSRLPESPKRNC